MASVTQKVNNYVLGISTQPDEKKYPGQVTDLVNGLPDVVEQLMKRPGSKLINTLSPSTAAHTTLDKLAQMGLLRYGDVVTVLRYPLIMQMLLEQIKLHT